MTSDDERQMNPKLFTALDIVLDDVIDVLQESGWDDEAEWYDDLRTSILAAEPDSPQFTEMLIELERSFLGLGTLVDIPLVPQLTDVTREALAESALDSHYQRLGLVSCASGIIREIKKSGG